MPSGTARQIAMAGCNDLEKPAVSVCPVIAEVLHALVQTQPWLARMSGSGATCFALYDDVAQRMMRPVGSIGPMRSSCLARLRHVLEPAEMRRV